MNTKETVAQRLDRAADRFEAAGDTHGAIDARAAAAMCRQCETLEEAEGIEEAFWATHQEPKRRVRDLDSDASDSDDGGGIDLDFVDSNSSRDDGEESDNDDDGGTDDSDDSESDNS